MRKVALLVSLVLFLLVLLSLTERADAPALLEREVVTMELDLEPRLCMQSQAAPSEGSVLDGWATIMSEGFEGAFPGPWQVADAEPGYGEYFWAKRDCEAYSGRYAGWAVGGGDDGSGLWCGDNYPDDAHSVMFFGPFSLGDATDAELTF
jgi:hypothetical protein